MKKILIIDCDGVAWQVFHGMPPLSHGDEGTSVIYGFLNHIFELQEFEKADHIVFAWDSRKSKRKKLFPEYKCKRVAAKKEYTEEEQEAHRSRSRQFALLRKNILPSLGFSNVFMKKGYEGDDIIASVALDQRAKNFVRIIGNDGDLFQLIDDNCTIFNLVQRKVMDSEYFFEKYGVYPDMWADIKGIAGCSGDDVPGIYNVGYDRAINYLLGNMKPSSVLYKRIKDNPKTIRLTRKLVVLPFKGAPKYTLQKDECTVAGFKKVAREYGLKSYLSADRIKSFKGLFCNGGKESPTKKKQAEGTEG